MANEIKISGKVKDVQLRYIPNGTPVSSFKLSVMHKSRKEGSKPTFSTFRCEAWKDVAEALQDKGDKLIEIKGYLKSNFYKRPDGTNVNQTLIVVGEFQEIILDKAVASDKGLSQSSSTYQQPKKTFSPAPKKTVPAPIIEEENDPDNEEAPF